MAGAGLSRLLSELRAAPAPGDGEGALARLRASRSEAEGVSAIEIGERGERRLGELREAEAEIVRLARGVYGSVPTSDARVNLLRIARRAARVTVIAQVAVNDEATHLGRVVIDAPRKILRRVGIDVAEPGDRFGPERYTHCFFDEEALLGEYARAGLSVTERRGFTFVLRALEEAPSETAESFAREVARVARLVRAVDRQRMNASPERAVASMRALGREATERGPIGRARLRRAVGWIDAVLPGGASCYRRILLEVALDAGAARETVVFGLDVGRTGHVAFENREERTFDVSFAIAARP